MRRRVLSLVIGFVFSFPAAPALAKSRWTELNIGPFYVSSERDSSAREALVQLEQLRWVLGNLLESKDLPSLWPIRIMFTANGDRNAASPSQFVWQNAQYLLVSSSGARLPLAEVAGLLLDVNTPRLPPEVESGLRQLFSTLEAHGSRVTWGAPPPHPDLDWARMQLFATKFEYGASFHIFLTALKGGSTLAAAERNAFGKTTAELEEEARANLASGNWQAVPVSGRPLDPKRDFGEHEFDSAQADVYLADWTLASDRPKAEAAYKAAVAAGGSAAALGYEGLGALARMEGKNPEKFWDHAIHAGSHSAPVYVSAAEGLSPVEALPLLKRAAQLNERWSAPIYAEAQLAATPADKETLLRTALRLDPRNTSYWVELAQLQTVAGEATAAQGSWLRAEDSAANSTERDRVHQLRLASEQQRLDAAEEAQRRDRDSVHLADQQAQQAESDRIRAAEQKANEANDNASGDQAPPSAVAWDSLARQKKLSGSLTRVDCLNSGWRLSVRERSGSVTQLFLPKDSKAIFTCGAQPHPRRVSLEYTAATNDELHTAGDITDLRLQ